MLERQVFFASSNIVVVIVLVVVIIIIYILNIRLTCPKKSVPMKTKPGRLLPFTIKKLKINKPGQC